MKQHRLYEIDLERGRAFCTDCGYTEIYVPKTRTCSKPRMICLNKARELWLDNQDKQKHLREERQLKPDWKPRHILAEINIETLRATCAVCARTDIRKVIQGKYSRYVGFSL